MSHIIYLVSRKPIGHFNYTDVNTESFVHRSLLTAGWMYMQYLFNFVKNKEDLDIYLSQLSEIGLTSVDNVLFGKKGDDEIAYRFNVPWEYDYIGKNPTTNAEEFTKRHQTFLKFVKYDTSTDYVTVKGKTSLNNSYININKDDTLIHPIDAIGIKCRDEYGRPKLFEYHLSNMCHKIGFLSPGSIIRKYMTWNRETPNTNWISHENRLTVEKVYSILDESKYQEDDCVLKILPYYVDNKHEILMANTLSWKKYDVNKVISSDYFASSVKTLFEIRQYYKWLYEHDYISHDSFDDINQIFYKKYYKQIKTYAEVFDIKYDRMKNTTKENNIETISTNNKEKKGIMKGIFGNLMEKYKGMLVPVTDPRLKITMDGNVAVKNNDGEYVTIKANNEIVSYPSDFTIDVPIYIIKKPFAAVSIGDVVRKDSTYVKVTGKNPDGSLKCLSFTGYTTTKKGVVDFMLGTSYADVVVNIMNVQNSGINPMMLAFMNGGDNGSLKDLMMMSMMMGQNGAGMNPMMMALMLSGKDGENSKMSDMMEMMMMMQMMGQNSQQPMANPFTSMFNTGAMNNTAFNPFEAFKNMANGGGEQTNPKAPEVDESAES